MDNQTVVEKENGVIPAERALVVYVDSDGKESTAHDAVKIEEKKKPEREVAYVIKDAYFPDFNVLKSDNGWWMDVRRTNKLIEGLKSGITIKVACSYAGISRNQYYYFIEAHPHFSDVLDGLKDIQMIGFMNTINEQGKDDLQTARWYMDRRHPDFANKIKVEGDQTLKPTTINNVAIITGTLESAKIADAIKKLTESILLGREDEGVSDGGSGQGVEGSGEEQGA